MERPEPQQMLREWLTGRRFVENGLLAPAEEHQGRKPAGRPKVPRVTL